MDGKSVFLVCVSMGFTKEISLLPWLLTLSVISFMLLTSICMADGAYLLARFARYMSSGLPFLLTMSDHMLEKLSFLRFAPSCRNVQDRLLSSLFDLVRWAGMVTAGILMSSAKPV